MMLRVRSCTSIDAQSFVYRELPLSAVPKMMLEAALLVSAVLVIIGASYAFGRIIALERIPPISPSSCCR